MEVAPAPPVPQTARVFVGSEGQSCDAACAGHQSVCVVAGLAALNNCNILRERFMCEAGCADAQPGQGEFPGYVTSQAAKNQWPAFCGTLPASQEGSQPAFNCSHAASNVRRLCTCEPAPPQQVPVAAGAAQGAQPQGGGAVAAAGDPAAAQKQAAAAQEVPKPTGAAQQPVATANQQAVTQPNTGAAAAQGQPAAMQQQAQKQ